MPLEQQVCSLELAKELKELGYPQESLFYWDIGKFPVRQDGKDRKPFIQFSKKVLINESYISAPTVAELGKKLPQIIKIKKIKYQLFCSVAMDKKWFVVYANEKDYTDNAPFPFLICDTEADARAKMLIYLIKNKHIELK